MTVSPDQLLIPPISMIPHLWLGDSGLRGDGSQADTQSKRSRTANIHAAVHKSQHKPHYKAKEPDKGLQGFHSHISWQDYWGQRIPWFKTRLPFVFTSVSPKRETAGSNPAWRARKPRKQTLFRGFSFSIPLIIANEYIRLASFLRLFFLSCLLTRSLYFACLANKNGLFC